MTEERLHEIDQHIADGGGDCNGTTDRALKDLVAEVRRLSAEVAMAYGHDYAKANPTYTGPCPLCHREDMADEVIRLREQLAAIDTLHKQWVIKFISGYERSKGVERLVDAIGKILHPQEREA